MNSGIIRAMKTPLEQAIANVGSQTKLAMLIGVSQPRISKWVAQNRLPAEFVLAIEKEAGVSRHDLRPDIYPIEI